MKRDRTGDAPKSAAELMAELQQDPAFMAREQERKHAQGRNVAEYREAAADLLKELAAAGFVVESVGELRHKRVDYRKAVPMLLSWLPRLTNAHVKEDVVRTLSVPCAQPMAARPLIVEFERPGASDALKWAIGNALEVVADDSVMPDLVRLARDQKHGKSREMAVLALGNASAVDGPHVDALIELLHDPQVAVQAAIALGKLEASSARPHLESIAREATGLLKKEAKKALAKL